MPPALRRCQATNKGSVGTRNFARCGLPASSAKIGSAWCRPHRHSRRRDPASGAPRCLLGHRPPWPVSAIRYTNLSAASTLATARSPQAGPLAACSATPSLAGQRNSYTNMSAASILATARSPQAGPLAACSVTALLGRSAQFGRRTCRPRRHSRRRDPRRRGPSLPARSTTPLRASDASRTPARAAAAGSPAPARSATAPSSTPRVRRSST